MSDSRAIAAELRPRLRTIDLEPPRSIHILGIGGAGMRAIARVLLAMGHSVTGSDRAGSRHTEALEALGAGVFTGHDARNIAGAQLITRSTAVPDDNPEVVAALAAGLPVYSRAEMLAAITARKPAILVAGTHGKTTTSSILAVVLDHAGLAPSFVIGADVAHFGSGARWLPGEHFVVEADESDGTFLALGAAHGVVTSLDPDHLEFYGTADRLTSSFEAFVDSIPGSTAVCADDPDTLSLRERSGVVTYGTAAGADLRITGLETDREATHFDVVWRGSRLGRVLVGLPGHHNALNAGAAIVVALELGIDFDTIAEGLARFGGVARRFEVRGEHLGVRFIDDYAHLPAEVEAAIATARQGGWRRVVAAYQPHRYSRTESLGATFARSFVGVDHLVLTDIYPSGEAPRAGVSGRIVFDAVTDACPDLSVSWQSTLPEVVDHLGSVLGPGDLCLTLGAGDLTSVPDLIIERLARRGPGSVAWLRDLQPELPATRVEFDAPLGPLTTYRVGGAAMAYAEVGSRADLERLVAAARGHRVPILPIGKGSNLLIAERGVAGLALGLAGDFDAITIDGTTVVLGAAVALPVAARKTVAASLTGFEWAVGVPGSLGGAIAMNAGGHGSDMSATVRSATVLDLSTGRVDVRSADDLAFGYRSSSIAATELVLDATMGLAAGDRSEGETLLSEIVRWRRDHQPGGQNAGSVFTNPPGDSAGRLIDVSGAKGLRIGSAEVSTKHANFIQVDPGGSADDVHALMLAVAEVVERATGVALEPETRLVGFDEPQLTGDPVLPRILRPDPEA